jgi:hypothetical protein
MELTDSQREAWDKLGQRYEKVGFGELSNDEQHYVVLEALAGDTLNGPLDQYFFNYSGDLALVAIEALDALGEEEASATLRAVIMKLWPTGYPTDRSDRYENIAAVRNEAFLDTQSEIIVATHERFLARCLDLLADQYSNE